MPIRIIPAIHQHVFGLWPLGKSRSCADVVIGLTCGQEHADGACYGVGDSVQCRVHAAFGAANQATTPLFRVSVLIKPLLAPISGRPL